MGGWGGGAIMRTAERLGFNISLIFSQIASEKKIKINSRKFDISRPYYFLNPPLTIGIESQKNDFMAIF